METPACERVFVYGTLRRGQAFRPAVEHLITEAIDATIRARMYHFAEDGSRGEWPFIVPGDDVIVGEVLAFSDFTEALRLLDDVEDYPDLYTREVVSATLVERGLEGGKLVDAWAYFIQPGQEKWGRTIPGGDWVADHSNGDAL